MGDYECIVYNFYVTEKKQTKDCSDIYCSKDAKYMITKNIT